MEAKQIKSNGNQLRKYLWLIWFMLDVIDILTWCWTEVHLENEKDDQIKYVSWLY